ncbi:MAG: Polysaccharide biosynthesis protein [Sphingobacteriaceae bacterium]|jgi:O-antigen/teichoic acid export membrane protein|nr:Polysaccharide biosynthesis protein [Sphingobacteriaceae bacterium]
MKIPAIPGFGQASFEKYLKNTGWLMMGKIFSMLVGFIIARYLGPGSFGDLSFAESFTFIFAAVSTLGLDSFIVREILNEPEHRDEILGTAFWMRAAVSLLIVPLPILIYSLYHNASTTPGTSLTLIIALLSAVSLFRSFNVIDSYFQSQIYSKPVVQVQNICLLISSIVKIGLIYYQMPVLYFAMALLFDSIILAIGLSIIYHKKNLHFSNWTFNWLRAKSLLNQSWPLIITAVMISIYMKIDAVMLKQLGSEEVGIYSAAAKISESWYFIPVAIVTSVFPAIIQARRDDLFRYQKRLQNLYDLLVGISLPVAFFVSFFANDIIHLFYGHKFEGAGPMLTIHIWSGIFVFLGSASSQYLLAEGFTYIAFIRTSVGALINVALNIWLIPLYGGVGASIATLIAYIFATFSLLFIGRTRKQGILMLKSLFLISLIQKFPRK